MKIEIVLNNPNEFDLGLFLNKVMHEDYGDVTIFSVGLLFVSIDFIKL
jgi:hypothetical protein